jgi:hypothetical protein
MMKRASGDGERIPRDEGGHEGKNDQYHGQVAMKRESQLLFRIQRFSTTTVTAA